MNWPRHTLCFIAAYAVIITVPQFIPQFYNWRIYEWHNVEHVLDFTPRPRSGGDAVEEEKARLRPDLAPVKDATQKIVDANGALNSFYAALQRVERHEPGAVVRILHFGDSPSTADLITADVRSFLHQNFGDAGHGVYLIAKPWAWYDHRGFYVKSSGWTIEPATMRTQKDGWYGLGGVSFTGRDGAWSLVDIKEGGQTKLTLHYVGQPGGGRVRIDAQGVHIATLDTNMPEKLSATASWRIPPETKYMELHVEGGPVRLFCFEFEKDQPGIVYSSIGLNGASATALGAYMNGDHLANELKESKADLVVLNYGTNESNFANYIDTTYARDERNMVERVRAALPNASVLMISPMDHGVRDSGGAISTAPALPRLIRIQQDIAKEEGCAYFNTFEAMGGTGTMGRWYAAEPRLVAADFIHPLPSGARIVGTLLYNAIRDGYNRYKLDQLRSANATKETAKR